jgi:hypothetical protein
MKNLAKGWHACPMMQPKWCWVEQRLRSCSPAVNTSTMVKCLLACSQFCILMAWAFFVLSECLFCLCDQFFLVCIGVSEAWIAHAVGGTLWMELLTLWCQEVSLYQLLYWRTKNVLIINIDYQSFHILAQGQLNMWWELLNTTLWMELLALFLPSYFRLRNGEHFISFILTHKNSMAAGMQVDIWFNAENLNKTKNQIQQVKCRWILWF